MTLNSFGTCTAVNLLEQIHMRSQRGLLLPNGLVRGEWVKASAIFEMQAM